MSLDRLYSGDWNHCHQERRADGTVVLTFGRNDDRELVRLVVRDLHGPDETVLEESTVYVGPPAHMAARFPVRETE